jgi:hypothetical protein
MKRPRMYALTQGEFTYTFARRGDAGILITTWHRTAWLVRRLVDAGEAQTTWRRLRRDGYRPAPHD